MSNTGLLNALEELCQKGASGMLIAVTEDNHHVRIGLQKGEIVHLATHRFLGSAAIPAIAAQSFRNHSFTAGAPLQVQLDIPATEVILGALRSGEYTTAKTDVASTPASGAGVDAGLLRMIEEELTEYLGPIASILMGDAKKQPTLTAILQKLARELPSAAAKEAFINKVKARLKSG